MLNIVPPAERSVVIGFTQTFVGLVVLATMLSGALVDFIGYTGLMIISLLAYLGCLWFARQIREKPMVMEK